MMTISTLEQTFWQHYQRFSATPLITEQPHPDTLNLSELSNTDPKAAISCLQQADSVALQKLATTPPKPPTCDRIFILGCGASGRMAVWLENLWRRVHLEQPNKIVGVIAGGDYALIRSIEQFEDQVAFAAQQLKHYGFGANDLLIATTASGESPFVLAAVEHALHVSTVKPWLVYCNPTETLCQRTPQHIVQDTRIHPIELNVGPMALTGSTRMQATTAMQLWLGWALFPDSHDTWQAACDWYQHADLSGLTTTIKQEADYLQSTATPKITYQSSANIGLTVMADMTERTPTFNIPNWYDFALTGQTNNYAAWQALLQRNPICLQWPDISQTHPDALYAFNINASPDPTPTWTFIEQDHAVHWHWNDCLLWSLKMPPIHPLYRETWLKCCLNIHSTVVMGQCGLFEGNIMTHLQPTNHKLIDRTVRYLHACHPERSYEDIATAIFALLPTLKSNQSIVQLYKRGLYDQKCRS